MLVHDFAARRPLVIRWLLVVVFTLVAGFSFTRYNDFPFLYHPAESTRATYLAEKKYPPTEPLLVRRTTDALVQLTATPAEPQALIEKGRFASAILSAVAVGGIVLLASRFAEALAGALAGLLAVTHAGLFESAHFMENHTGLLAGIAVAITALAHYGARPSLWLAALTGAGAGLAVAGKHLGIIPAVFALAGLCAATPPARARWIAPVVGFAAAAIAYAAISHPLYPILGLQFAPPEGMVNPDAIPLESKPLLHLTNAISVPLLAGVIYWFWRRWRARRHEPVIWRFIGVFFVVYVPIVSVFLEPNDSHLLPVSLIACALGATGIVEWIRHYRKHRYSYTRAIPRTVAVAALVLNFLSISEVYPAFQRDDRRELALEILRFVPHDAGVAHDRRVYLAAAKDAGLPGFELRNPLHVAPGPDGYAADLGSIAELRARHCLHRRLRNRLPRAGQGFRRRKHPAAPAVVRRTIRKPSAHLAVAPGRGSAAAARAAAV